MMILSLVALLALQAPAQTEGKPLEVVTTLGVLASLAREVGGARVHAEALAEPREDTH